MTSIALISIAFIGGQPATETRPSPAQNSVSQAAENPSHKLPQAATDSAAELLRSAISAHGGERFFTTLRAGRVKTRVRNVSTAPAALDETTIVEAFQMPGQFRQETTGTLVVDSVYVCSKGTAWESVGGGPYRPAAERVTVEQRFPFRILHQLQTAQRSPYTVELVGEEDIGGKKANILRVREAGQMVTDIAISASERLVIRMSGPTYNPTADRMGVATTIFERYRRFGTFPVPARQKTYLDGKLITECDLLAFELLDTINEDEFRRPATR